MPKINIKPHGITLNSIRSTIAQGLLRTRQTGSAEMKAVGRSLNSALAFYSASVLKGCNAALQPDLFGLLEKEVAEEIFLVNAHFKKWAFFFFFTYFLPHHFLDWIHLWNSWVFHVATLIRDKRTLILMSKWLYWNLIHLDRACWKNSRKSRSWIISLIFFWRIYITMASYDDR